MKENPSFYAIIPASVRYDKSLCPNAKLLYGEITALCEKEGYCWASNNYLSDLYGVNRSSITHWINQLIQAGHITQELVYNEDKNFIKERKIYLTNKMPTLPQKQIKTESDKPEKTAPAGDFGGLAALKLDSGENMADESTDEGGGGELFHHGGEISHHGGEILQEGLLNINIKESSSSEPKTEKSDFYKNEEEEAELKQFFKNLNPVLIFDKAFYPKARAFMGENGLDSGYADWLYRFCLDHKPKNIAGFYYKLFFQSQLVDLYRSSERPPPVTVFLCPVCGTEHDSALKACPNCGLKKADRYDRQCLDREKIFYVMPPDKKAAYEEELNNIFREKGLSRNLEEKNRLLKILDEKYSLNDPPE